MKVGKEKEVGRMLQGAKIFISMFDTIVSDISQKEIESYRNKLKNIK